MVQTLADKRFCVKQETFIRIEHNLTPENFAKIAQLEHNDVIIFTSANAVEAVKGILNISLPLRVYCISGQTLQEVVKSLPNARVMATAADGVTLAEKIIADGIKKVLLLCSNIRRDELPALMKQHNIDFSELAVYKTVETPKKTDKDYDAILFFSPSAVKSFFSMNQLDEKATCFSIGLTTATAIKSYCSNNVIIADSPTQEALAAAIIHHFQNNTQSGIRLRPIN